MSLEFMKYPHLERFGNLEVTGIEHGITYVFPKIDGTNASMWFDEAKGFCYGSRTRELSPTADNAGFMAVMNTTNYGKGYKRFLRKYPNLRLYGEWLVPHTLKNYRDDAWRRFYVFDVFDEDQQVFLPYTEYTDMIAGYEIDYIPCYKVWKNGGYEDFLNTAKEIKYLLKDETGFGEGCVIKRYDFQNRHGRTNWAKIVLAEFKEKHVSTKPGVGGVDAFEEQVANDLVTSALVDKEYSKIALEGWTNRSIPRLLETVYRCVVVEELYDYLNKNKKQSTINFKTLKHFVNTKVKELKKEVF